MTAPAVADRPSVAPADLANVAVFAALIAAMSLLPAIHVGGLTPITLQTLGVMLAGLCLGPWRGAAAVGLYLAVGIAGLPVFAGGKGGVAALLGPTGGYLVSFLIVAFLVGLAARFVVRRGLTKLTFVWFLLACMVTRVAVTWPLVVAGIARATGKSFGDLWATDFIFWPGDLLKAVVASLVAVAVHKAFPRLLGR